MNTNEEMIKIINRRNEISINYCIEKGWTTELSNLTFEQILEIRSLESWKNPLNSISDDSNQADA